MQLRGLYCFIALAALVAVPALADKAPGPENHCDPEFVFDIGPLFLQQPNGSFITTSNDCTVRPGCDDYFDLVCGGGETVTVSFCQGGGSAAWDTGLSNWVGGVLDQCSDDFCGLQSEITFSAVAGSQRVRVGGFADDSGPYTLAINAPSTCDITGAVPVELQNIDVE